MPRSAVGNDLAKQPKATAPRHQFGALPYRRNGEGLEIMLISSRETRRWVLPKGWPMKGRKPHTAAAREALEEAGLVGHVAKSSIGTFDYQKRLENGASLKCTVTVFPMKVQRELKHWREATQRARQWFSIDEATRVVDEMQLRTLIEQFGRDRTAHPVK